MSKSMTPEDLLNARVEEFNKGNLSFSMTLYENDACLASKPGQVVKELEGIRQTFQDLIAMGGKLEAKAKKVLQAGGLALLITEWSITGAEPDGKPIKLTSRGEVVLRSQSDDSWLMVIENPWGTDWMESIWMIKTNVNIQYRVLLLNYNSYFLGFRGLPEPQHNLQIVSMVWGFATQQIFLQLQIKLVLANQTQPTML
jgi:ketosteroid isomerase-like protein